MNSQAFEAGNTRLSGGHHSNDSSRDSIHFEIIDAQMEKDHWLVTITLIISSGATSPIVYLKS